MADECIHGFPTELCDICTPRGRAEPTSTPAPRRTRITTSLRSEPTDTGTGSRSAGRATAARAAAAVDTPAPVFSALRAHHFTHMDNLQAIVDAGAIVASTEAEPELDVSAPQTRAARRAVEAPDGTPVAAHVPFSLTTDAATWNEVRAGARTERWSESARRARATEFVILVVPTTEFGSDVIVADVDAHTDGARFAVGPDAASSLLRRVAITDTELRDVEVLAGPSVPLSAVALIGVPNVRARDEVRAILATADAVGPRVAVYPPWFQATPEV